MKTTKLIISLAATAMTVAAASAQSNTFTIKGGGDVNVASADEQHPLYVVNGRAVDFAELKNIDNSQIESFTVLKNAESTKVYASMGDVSNGVVVIELKGSEESVYTSVDKMPTFLDGDINTFRQWVMQQVRYPAQATEQNIQGNVLVKFIIGKDGLIELSNIEILSSPSEILSDEVIRVMKTSPKWKPGKKDGKSARVSLVMPVSFKLLDSDSGKVELNGKTISVSKGDSEERSTAVIYQDSAVDEIVVVGFGKK